MTEAEARDRACQGALLLDDKVPGWAPRIDIEQLNMASWCDCVLGQLYGDYGYGLSEIGAYITDFHEDGLREGYDCFGSLDNADFPLLQTAWFLEIFRRQIELAVAAL